MKKKIALILAAVILVLSLGLAACGTADEGNTDTNPAGGDKSNGEKMEVDNAKVAAAANDGVFKIGLDPEFPPMGYRDTEGNYVGFDIDLAKEVAKRLGMEFEAVPINWGAKNMELGTGNIDCIWNGFTMTGREGDYLWTSPYVTNAQVIVVNEKSDIKTAADLAGKVLALQQGSTAENALNSRADIKDSLANTLFVADNVSALNELKAGGADAVLVDEVVADYYIAKNPGLKVIDSIAQESYGVGFALGNSALRDKVETTLQEMAKDGTMKKISEQWFGKDITTIK